MQSLQSLIATDAVPDGLLSALASRDVSLWLHKVPDGLNAESLAAFVRLPWREVFLTDAHEALLNILASDSDADLTRKRGFIQIIRSDPSLIPLPPRSLPIYVLDAGDSGFDATLKRMAMLGILRRSNVRRLLVLSGDRIDMPKELANLLDASFHPYVTLVSDDDSALADATAWAEAVTKGPPAQLVGLKPRTFVEDLTRRYLEAYPSETTLVRMRRSSGETILVDLTDADNVERPILANYDLIQERDLASISPEELSEEEFGAFFEGGEASWRPFAAGVPWLRNNDSYRSLERLLRRLDTVGSAENKIAYIASEPGAGGTTLIRKLAWEAARAGYPALVAKPAPFAPDALPLVGFLTKADQVAGSADRSDVEDRRLYETPWVIVFDRAHWEHREGELRRFLSELEKSGRPAIVLVVTGPIKPTAFYSEAFAREIAALTHIIDSSDAVALGRHLNVFLRTYGKERSAEEWERFYRAHSVRGMGANAAFWIALSFWLRSSRDLSGSIQEWIYAAFQEHGGTLAMKRALVEIAALSSERLALNEGLLPQSDTEWPLGVRLEDKRTNLAALGLIRVSAAGDQHWGLAHDILGRLLINALFHDHDRRVELGYGEARDAEHLRFLALKDIAVKPAMAELRYRAIADEFPTVIFKVDPAHGLRAFATIWREVLEALDSMPKPLRDTSRLFRHHTAISRRRIALLESPIYDVTPADQLVLLDQAIIDIEYAISSIERTPGDEPDLNLYNSLANAYLNLADVKAAASAPRDEVARLRTLANDATRRAYGENPTNPFVVETHIKNLLSIAKSEPGQAVPSCLEALQALYEALRGEDHRLRTPQLARLAEQALDILFASAPPEASQSEPQTEIDVLINAWRILSRAGPANLEESFAHLSLDLADEVLAALEHPVARGDIQVLRLRYGILSSARPFEFLRRIELLQNLQQTDNRPSPQLRLEYALLLYQVGRAAEADAQFAQLRSLWRNSEHFVRVPEPLNWLRDGEAEALATVQATMGSDQSYRQMARVQEFGNRTAPFRPEEFGVHSMQPGYRFRAHVSFGHNGPFLRPLGARTKRS